MERYESLQIRSRGLTRDSRRKEVLAALGEPLKKGTGGWGDLDTEVWRYLHYTDDAQHITFTVRFNPETGCSAGGGHYRRDEIRRGEKLSQTGTILGVYPNAPPVSGRGFYLHVRFDDWGDHWVVVANTNRVRGTPVEGGRIRVEHYAWKGHYVFVDYCSLLLESITLTKPDD